MGLSHSFWGNEDKEESSEDIESWNKLILCWNPHDAKLVDLARSMTKHGPIPSSLRAKAWFVISGASELMKNNDGLYEELYTLSSDKIDLIEKDCPRTSGDGSNHNICHLRRILTAYSNYDISLGYCQGMNYIASFLLDIFKENKDINIANLELEEQVFWTFVVILQQIRSIFIEGLPGFKKCADIFGILCKYHLPTVHNKWIKWNESLGIDIYKLILTPWFYSLFSYPPCLHYQHTARIWDIFLTKSCDFSIFIKIAFTIIASHKHKLIKMEFFDIIDFCKHLPFMKYGGKQLIQKSISIKLSEKYLNYTKDLTKFDRNKYQNQQNRNKKQNVEHEPLCCLYIAY